MFRKNSKEMRVTKEVDVEKLKDAISIELKKNHYCAVRASGLGAVYNAIQAIINADVSPVCVIKKESARTESGLIDVIVFYLALLDEHASVKSNA